MMVLACVIDGTVGPRELRLLRRAREVMRPMAPSCLLTEEARASEEAGAAHEAAVDSRIEERVCTWAKTIRNATSTFVSASCELIPSMHGRARARARVRRVSVRVARIARLLLLHTNPTTVRKRRSR